MKQSTEYWLKAADEDLITIRSILQQEELTHVVAFRKTYGARSCRVFL